MPTKSRLRADRRPGSLEEAERLVAYNKRILATSQSPQRCHRAARMLANLQPELARLREISAQQSPVPTPPVRAAEREAEFEVVWDGRHHGRDLDLLMR